MFGSHLPANYRLDASDMNIEQPHTQTEDTGNIYCNLFQKTLRRILSEPSNLNVYERAIMGTQAADLKSILAACNTWEDYLWAYYFVKHHTQTNLVCHSSSSFNILFAICLLFR